MKVNYPESFYKSTGTYACYFFCLMKLAEEYTGFDFDINSTIQICSLHRASNGKQWLTFNWDNPDDPDNFDVNAPDEILRLLTGTKWSVSYEDANYKAKKNELVVECWYNKTTGLNHFRLKDWDPLFKSVTVRDGCIKSYRVFRRT